MITKLERMRSRPDHHKRGIALGVSAFLTAVIFSVWLSVNFRTNTSQIIVEKPKEDSPITNLKKSLASVYYAIKGLGKENNINFQDEYDRIKNQVETGQLRVVPKNDSY